MKQKIYKTEVEVKLKKNEYLVPIYKKFKKVKVIDYCDDCGHKTGSHIEKIPVGKPSGFYKKQKTLWDIVAENMIKDSIKQMEIFNARVLGDFPPSEIKFRRYAPLKVNDVQPLSKNEPKTD
jgi:hypothetical protein